MPVPPVIQTFIRIDVLPTLFFAALKQNFPLAENVELGTDYLIRVIDWRRDYPAFGQCLPARQIIRPIAQRCVLHNRHTVLLDVRFEYRCSAARPQVSRTLFEIGFNPADTTQHQSHH
jgi:hypothetical protein